MEKLIFFHIPKTAGSTFINILSNNFDEKSIYTIDGLEPYKSIEELSSFDEDQKSIIRLLRGHLTLGLDKLFKEKCTYITYLRDPIDLFISSFFYIKRVKEHNYYELVNSMQDINEFIEFRKHNNQDNLQTRHLAGIATNMKKSPIRFDIEGDKYFELAKNNLMEKIEYVFVTEKFNESLIFLKNRLGLENISYLSANVTKNRLSKSDISVESINRIRAISQYDIELYNLALEKHNSLINNLDLNMSIELKELARANSDLVRKMKVKNSLKNIVRFFR